MSLISLLNVSHQAGTKPLFAQLSFAIEAGDRIGLVGHNGCGKSTLLALIAGDTLADDGEVQVQRGLIVGRVEQFLPEALTSLGLLDAVLDALPAEQRLIEQYRVENLLTELGFTRQQWGLPMSGLSGGQKNLALFARALIQEPELLLLDEPGNHMDSTAMWQLKRFLQKPDIPAFIMISHDRDLLDSVTRRTLWIRDEKIYSFHQPYSEARERLAQHDDAAARKRKAEEQQIDKLQSSARRLAHWGKVYDNEDLARKAKSMEKRIDKLEADKTFVSAGTGLSLQVDAEFMKVRQLFIMEQETIRTPDAQPLFHVDELVLRPGDRVALLGVNGSGKSCAIRALIAAHQQPLGEQIRTRFNPNVRLGYFDQELEQFDSDLSLTDWVREHSLATDDAIRQALIHWGFPYVDHDRSVQVLSGGERARVLLMTFQLDQPNLLIMDEPTNHIDLQGKEALESDLIQPGLSLLFTSHDQRFIERVATRYWWIYQGQLTEIHDLNDYFRAFDTPQIKSGPTRSPTEHQTGLSDSADVPEDDVTALERICELEALLADDLARKPKFQKPERQQRWRLEIDRLMARIE